MKTEQPAGGVNPRPTAAEPWGDFVDLRGERWYVIRNVDRLRPFMVTVVSSDDHWLFLSSTGGMTAKRYGRVGDSPIIGAGTWADERCATSGTGSGEYFIRLNIARDLCARLEYLGLGLAEAGGAWQAFARATSELTPEAVVHTIEQLASGAADRTVGGHEAELARLGGVIVLGLARLRVVHGPQRIGTFPVAGGGVLAGGDLPHAAVAGARCGHWRHAIDPVQAIGEVCRRHGLWLHVDACYGGAALLLEELRERFEGIECADSIAVDVTDNGNFGSGGGGSGGGSGGGGGGCFLSSAHQSFNSGIVTGSAISGFILIIWGWIVRLTVYHLRHRLQGAGLMEWNRICILGGEPEKPANQNKQIYPIKRNKRNKTC